MIKDIIDNSAKTVVIAVLYIWNDCYLSGKITIFNYFYSPNDDFKTIFYYLSHIQNNWGINVENGNNRTL